MLRFHKKGLAMGQIVIIFLMIVGFLLIATTVSKAASKAEPKNAEIMCHNSIAFRAQTHISSEGDFVSVDIKPVPVMCRTIDRKISGSREEIKDHIAYSMARCWWMFGEGRYEEILDNGGVGLLPGLFGFDDYENECFNCYNILIDQDEIEGGPIGPDEMTEYLINTDHRNIKGVSYLDYIQSFGGEGRAVFTAPSILPREAYTVSMMPINKDDSEFWATVAKIGVGLVVFVGVVAGGVCIIATSGACLGIIAGGSAGGGGTAGVAAAGAVSASVTAASSLGATKGLLVAGASAYTAVSGFMDVMEDIYEERDVSSVYFGFSEVGQKMCGTRDIAGN